MEVNKIFKVKKINSTSFLGKKKKLIEEVFWDKERKTPALNPRKHQRKLTEDRCATKGTYMSMVSPGLL